MNCTEIHGFSLVNSVSMAVAVLSNGKFLTLFLALHAAVQSFSAAALMPASPQLRDGAVRELRLFLFQSRQQFSFLLSLVG